MRRPVEPAYFYVAPASLSLPQKESHQLTIWVSDQLKRPLPTTDVSFSVTTGTNFVSVSDSGRVTSLGPHGRAVVVASIKDLSDTVVVTVTQKPTSLWLNGTRFDVLTVDSVHIVGRVLDAVGDTIGLEPVTLIPLDPSKIASQTSTPGRFWAFGTGVAEVVAQSVLPDSSVFVSLSMDSSISHRIFLPAVRSVTFDSSGSLLTQSGWSRSPWLTRWSLPDFTQTEQVERPLSGPLNLTADGSRAFYAAGYAVGVMDMESLTEVDRVLLGEDVGNVLVDVGRKLVYAVTSVVGSPQIRLHVLDAITLARLRWVVIPQGECLPRPGWTSCDNPGGSAPSGGMAIHPTEPVLYFPDGREGAVGAIVAVDLDADTLIARFNVGGRPLAVRNSHAGDVLFVADYDGFVRFVDPASGQSIGPAVAAGGPVFDVAQTPDGSEIYANLRESGRIVVIDLATRTVVRSIFSGGGTATETGTPPRPYHEGGPYRIAFSPDGRFAVAANLGYPRVATGISQTVGWIDVIER